MELARRSQRTSQPRKQTVHTSGCVAHSIRALYPLPYLRRPLATSSVNSRSWSSLRNLGCSSPLISLTPDHRAALWETGLLRRLAGAQRALPLPVEQDMAELPSMSGYETMLGEYASMGIHPRPRLMAYLRDRLPASMTRAEDLEGLPDDAPVQVCGLVVRRQHPAANAVFLTLEDETGHSPVVIWPAVFEKFRFEIRAPVLMVWGRASRRQGVMNIAAARVRGIKQPRVLPPSRSRM